MKVDWMQADPMTIICNTRDTGGFNILGTGGGIGFDCDQESLGFVGLDASHKKNLSIVCTSAIICLRMFTQCDRIKFNTFNSLEVRRYLSANILLLTSPKPQLLKTIKGNSP